MPEIGSGSLFNRAEWAGQNLLAGNLPGVGRSLLMPGSLSPAEMHPRKTLAEEWGIADGPWGAMWRTVTNPLFLLSAFLSVKFPVPTLRRVTSVSKEIAGYDKKVGWTSWLWSSDVVMENTASAAALLEGAKDKEAFVRRVFAPYATGMEKYGKATKNFAPMRAEQLRVAAALDGLDKLPPIPGKDLSSVNRALGLKSGTPWFNPIKLDEGGKMLFDGARESQRIAMTEEMLDVLETDPVGKWMYATLKGGKGEKLKIPEHYFPRRPLHTLETFDEEAERIKQITAQQISKSMDLGKLASEQSYKTSLRKIATEIDPSVKKRLQRSLPDPRQLRELEAAYPGTLVDPKLPDRLEDFLVNNPVGQKFHTYSLELEPVMEDWVNGLSSTYAWVVKGHGRTLMKDYAKFAVKESPYFDKNKAKLLGEVYIPGLLGRRSLEMQTGELIWKNKLIHAKKWLEKPTVQKVIGKKTTDTLVEWIDNPHGPLTKGAMSTELSKLFYSGALGLPNLGAALINLTQTVFVAGLIGADAVTGMAIAARKIPKYFAVRRKFGHEVAMSKVFPQFIKAGIHGSPVSDEVVEGALQRAWDAGFGKVGLLRENIHRAEALSMAAFRGSEAFVRIAAFEGAFRKGVREARKAGLRGGKAIEQARRDARWITDRTQFLGGPMSTPAILRTGPLSGPLMKQFLRFGLGGLQYAAKTGPRSATGFEGAPTWFGRNLGWAGRMGMVFGVAHGLKDTIGVDLEKGLGYGVFNPLSPPGTPGYPLPIPPIASIAMGAYQDLESQEPRNFQRNLQLVTPGGVGAYKALGVVGPALFPNQVPRTMRGMGREYVDYTQTTPDGRYSVFSGKGTLVGYETPVQLFMRSVGLRSAGMEQEQQITGWLVGQAKRLREYRREWLDAMMRNDYRNMRRVETEYEKAYPGMGGLQVKETDIRSVQLRREIPRIERTLEALPAEVRPMFGEAIMTALMASGANPLGIDPRMLQQGTSRSRAAARPPVPQGGYQAIREHAPGEPQSVGRTVGAMGSQLGGRQAIPDVHPGFPSFASFD